MSSTDTNQASELDRIFYNPDHTKTYNPSNKPTGVVMTDFDIYQATEAIQSLIRTEKLKLLDRLESKASYDPSGRSPLINPLEIQAERNKLEAEL